MSLNMKLKKLRGAASQAEIAQKLNITRSTYSHYENGRRFPNESMLKNLAEIYNVSIDYLLDHNIEITENTEILNNIMFKLKQLNDLSEDDYKKISEYIDFLILTKTK